MRTRTWMRCALLVLVVVAVSCGSDTTAPTAPSGTSTGTNHAPEIIAATVTPGFGVSGLTPMQAHVVARDPDRDTLTFTWKGGVTGVNGGFKTVSTTQDFTFMSGEVLEPLTVTVTDSKGATTSIDVNFTTASFAQPGSYDGHFGSGNSIDDQYFSLRLTRQGMVVTGTVILFANGSLPGDSGTIDPEHPGQIDAAGHFAFRFKMRTLANFTMVGDLAPTPRGSSFSNFQGTGRGVGGPVDGQTFIFRTHDPY
jgi:hypothetical protein